MAQAPSAFPKHSLSINAFRNPSIGLEYQRGQWSVHAGYYLTNFSSGVTTSFAKAGISYWWLPVGRQPIRSSFYAGASYLRGLSRDYRGRHAVAAELGFRWYIWQGLHARLGVIALASQGQPLRINPTPSIGYSIRF